MDRTTRALSAAAALLAATLAAGTWAVMAGKCSGVEAALVASSAEAGEEKDAVMVEDWMSSREEPTMTVIVDPEVAAPNRPGVVGSAVGPRVLSWKEVLVDERAAACRADAVRACRLVVELGIPLEMERLVEATAVADSSRAWGVLETLRELIRAYGGRRLWERAETAEQKRALRGILMDENDLSELLDAPLGEVRSW